MVAQCKTMVKEYLVDAAGKILRRRECSRPTLPKNEEYPDCRFIAQSVDFGLPSRVLDIMADGLTKVHCPSFF